MEQFIRDVGFLIADNWAGALFVAGALVLAGLVLAYSGIRDHAAFSEYRVLAIIVGFVIATGAVVALPLLRGEAEDACEAWSRSPEPADELAYVEKECERHF